MLQEGSAVRLFWFQNNIFCICENNIFCICETGNGCRRKAGVTGIENQSPARSGL